MAFTLEEDLQSLIVRLEKRIQVVQKHKELLETLLKELKEELLRV